MDYNYYSLYFLIITMYRIGLQSYIFLYLSGEFRVFPYEFLHGTWAYLYK